MKYDKAHYVGLKTISAATQKVLDLHPEVDEKTALLFSDEIQALWKAWKKSTSPRALLEGADLAGMQLSMAGLQSARLAGADLSKTRAIAIFLTAADLTNAKVRQVVWHGIEFGGACCHNVDFSGSELSDIHFSGDFRNADFANAKITRVFKTSSDADFSGANFQGCTLDPRDQNGHKQFLALLSPQQRAQLKVKKCFIATACCDDDAWQLGVLRRFRDEVLNPTSPGRWLVDFYERVSPAIASWIRERAAFRWLVRSLLVTPMSWTATMYLDTWVLSQRKK